MRDVIKNVIAAEAEARELVAMAQAEADRITADAQKRSQDIVARAHLEARAGAHQIVDTAMNEAGREKQERLVRATAEIKTQVRLEETVWQRAVAGAVRCVCGMSQN